MLEHTQIDGFRCPGVHVPVVFTFPEKGGTFHAGKAFDIDSAGQEKINIGLREIVPNHTHQPWRGEMAGDNRKI
jgi:hypothetical protein